MIISNRKTYPYIIFIILISALNCLFKFFRYFKSKSPKITQLVILCCDTKTDICLKLWKKWVFSLFWKYGNIHKLVCKVGWVLKQKLFKTEILKVKIVNTRQKYKMMNRKSSYADVAEYAVIVRCANKSYKSGTPVLNDLNMSVPYGSMYVEIIKFILIN